MKKPLLSSIFLHAIFFLLIFLSFNLKDIKEPQEKEVSVTVIPFDENKETNLIAPKETPKIEPPKEEVKPEPKVEPKPEPKTKPKEEKKLPEKKIPEKKPEVKKPEEKPIPKKEEKPVEKKEPKKIEEKKPEIKPTAKKEEKPVEKKEEKKVEEKKPEEKKPEEKPKEDINKILDQVAKEEKPAEKKEEKKIEEKKEAPVTQNKDRITEAKQDPNSLENLNLSPREKLNIQSQLKRCYQRAVAMNHSRAKITVIIKTKINKDGYITSNLENLIDYQRYNDPKEIGYKTTLDNVRKAITSCSPLRNLPADKYDVWKDVTLEFDEETLH